MSLSAAPVRVRFAPSPTGSLHIGTARTALFDWLLARQTGGQFILRIEDTDRSRYVPGSLEELMDGLRWLGLEWDEGPDIGGPYGPYLQSERLPIYHAHAQRLLDSGDAYESYYTSEEIEAITKSVGQGDAAEVNRLMRAMPADEARRRREAGVKPAVLFKVPLDGETVARDEIRGEIRTPNRTLRDPVLVKSDGFPTYHLAAMVDDYLMRITHVLRGQEWLPSLPFHILIIRALGWEPPLFVHPSIFLDPSGKGKMSKRRGSTTDQPTFVRDFRAGGYLPEAVVNWAALMGWGEEGGDREVYTIPELVQAFKLDRVRPSPTAVNYEKLDWLNGLHIRMLAPDELARRLVPFMHRAGVAVCRDDLLPLTPLVQQRLTTLDEAPDLLDFFFVPPPAPTVEELIPKKMTAADTRAALEASRALLATLEPFTAEPVEAALRGLAEERGWKAGDLFSILRVALSSKRVAPPLFGTIEHLGHATTLERIDQALALLA